MCDGERDSSDTDRATSSEITQPSLSSKITDTVSRRGMLRTFLAASVASGTVFSGCLYLSGINQKISNEPSLRFVSHEDRITSTDATHVVRSETDLRSALAIENSTVWLPEDVELLIDGSTPIPIASNVTLASNRGVKGGRGALIETTMYHPTVFRSRESGIRVTGLRVKGPETTYFDPRTKPRQESAYYSRGFELFGDEIEIDHCELFGWTSAAVSLGARNEQTRSRVHHNTIHHNQMQTLGYGIDLRNGTHRIEWNYFDWNRHSVAGFGHRQNGYEARFNVVGSHAVRHAFDMHGLRENITSYSGPLAGKYIRVHHNVFALTDAAAVVLRGASAQQSWVTDNWCAAIPLLELHGRQSIIRQTYVDSPVRFQVADNHYGPRAVERGRNCLLERANEDETAKQKRMT
jgi:hypothetical protein